MKNIGCRKTEGPVYERVCQMSPKCANGMRTWRWPGERKSRRARAQWPMAWDCPLRYYYNISQAAAVDPRLWSGVYIVAGMVVVHLINDGSWPVCSFVLLLLFIFFVFGLYVWYIMVYWDNFLCHVVRDSLNVMTIYIKHFTNLKAHKREHKTSLFL